MKNLALYFVIGRHGRRLCQQGGQAGAAGHRPFQQRASDHRLDSTRARPTPAKPTRDIVGNELTDPNSPLSKRSVYFDYDSNAVKDEYRGLVTAHSRYLADKRDSRIRIEGNCDERGKPRVQPRARPAPRRIGEEGDDRPRRRRRPHRDHELRRREADGDGPRRSGVGPEPPRGHQVRW